MCAIKLLDPWMSPGVSSGEHPFALIKHCIKYGFYCSTVHLPVHKCWPQWHLHISMPGIKMSHLNMCACMHADTHAHMKMPRDACKLLQCIQFGQRQIVPLLMPSTLHLLGPAKKFHIWSSMGRGDLLTLATHFACLTFFYLLISTEHFFVDQHLSINFPSA